MDKNDARTLANRESSKRYVKVWVSILGDEPELVEAEVQQGGTDG